MNWRRAGLLAGCLLLLLLPASSVRLLERHHHPALQHVTGLQDGDIVLVGSDRLFWARIASEWSTPEHRFGHSGIFVTTKDGTGAVVHADGSPSKGEAPVIAEPLPLFLPQYERAGIYRLRADAAARHALAAAARVFVAEHAVFDKHFTLNDRHRLYCTALIWRAALEGVHRDIVPVKTTIGGRVVITLADIERSPALQPVTFKGR